MLRRYAKLFVELFEQLKQKSVLEKKMTMKALGCKFIGQGYMIQGYSSLDHNAFYSSLEREVDFIKDYKKLSNINIVDAGANLGFYSIVYSMIKGVNVISFEPFPETYSYLESNINNNNISNIISLRLGLYSKRVNMPIGRPDAYKFYSYLNKFFKFTDRDQHGCCSVYTSDKSAPVAKFIKGDECEEIASQNSIDLIKIDVEGSELEVLKGLRSVIIKYQPMLKIEFNESSFLAAGVSNESVWRYLEDLGYKRFTVCSSENDLSNWLSMQEIPNLSGAKDMLFIV